MPKFRALVIETFHTEIEFEARNESHAALRAEEIAFSKDYRKYAQLSRHNNYEPYSEIESVSLITNRIDKSK